MSQNPHAQLELLQGSSLPQSVVATSAGITALTASATSTTAGATPAVAPTRSLLSASLDQQRHIDDSSNSATPSFAPPTATKILRASNSYSTLADSIRALRESNTSAAASNNSLSFPNPHEPLASRRKGSQPNPLRQSTTPGSKLYLREGLRSPLSTPVHDTPTSPRERLDALLSSESNRTGFEPSSVDSSRSKTVQLRQARSYGQLRNTPYPTVSTTSSPPISPSTVTLSRPDPSPIMPRNSSIDSTLSSISSTSQPSRHTGGSGYKDNASSVDIAALIASAGSAEAALQTLWREKQSAASHNAQLWRLVEKQRSMILGLNKDLERSLKEKERYRRKLKDFIVQNPGVGKLPRTDSALEREISQSPAPSDRGSEVSKRTDSPQTTRDGVEGRSSSATSKRTVPSPTDVQQMKSFSPHSTASSHDLVTPKAGKPLVNRTSSLPSENNDPTPRASTTPVVPPHKSSSAVSSEHTSIETSPVTSHVPMTGQRSQNHQLETVHTNQSSPPHQLFRKPVGMSSRTSEPQGITTPPQMSPRTPPILSITGATPIIDSGSFPSPPGRSTRKQAPAPLNLSQTKPSSVIAAAVATRQELEPSPPTREDEDFMDRGRRRTREDDERMREEIALREQEARSLSKKKRKSKSAGTTPIQTPKLNESVSQTATNSAAMLQPAAPPNHPPPPPPNMQNLLSPAASDSSMSSTTAHRSSIQAPMLSPGLPMSPRPGHKPLHSPQPRMPRHQLGPASPPTSPGFPMPPQGLPPSLKPPSPGRSDGTGSSAMPFGSPSAIPAPLFAQKSESKAENKTEGSVEIGTGSRPSQPTEQRPQRPDPARRAPSAGTERTLVDAETLTPSSDQPSITITESPGDDRIYKGLASEQYPGLLLPPNALPLITVSVFSSRLRPSRHSILMSKPNEENPVFLLGIYARSDNKQLWRLEKTSTSLPAFHNQIQSLCSTDAKLPDKNLFSGHAPAKVDARRVALNTYFDTLLDTPLNEQAALIICHFFSTDVIGAEPEGALPATETVAGTVPSAASTSRPRREGYLTKRGKNFGGWKARYFILEGPELRYYESPGGPQIGVIRLVSAQIGKQSANSTNGSPLGREDDDNQYRHAFLILEPKKKDSSSHVRHVLCAESDMERDAWVDALMAYVDSQDDKSRSGSSAKSSTRLESSKEKEREREKEKPSSSSVQPGNKENHDPAIQHTRKPDTPEPGSVDTLQTVSYEETVQAQAPVHGPSSYHNRGMPSPTLNSGGFPRARNPQGSGNQISISGPTNAMPIKDTEAWGYKTPAKEKKRSIFGFRGRSSSDLAIPTQATLGTSPPYTERRNVGGMQHSVFGMPLTEAIECSQPSGIDVQLPAVVYRSIEYLQAKEAVLEEGIFRLSGSNITIKALRERFNSEGDVKLLDGEYYDVHAVASLLKLYLRELPNSILTRELHLDFLKALDLDEKHKKLEIFNVLVHKLPPGNWTLLHALCSLLIDIINNSDRNKMNVRNVGIVFAPTLNIPAPLISMFLTDFDAIFGTPVKEETSPIHEISQQQSSLSSDAVRSPRTQMFTDLHTPMFPHTPSQAPSSNGVPGLQPLMPGPSHGGPAHNRNTFMHPPSNNAHFFGLQANGHGPINLVPGARESHIPNGYGGNAGGPGGGYAAPQNGLANNTFASLNGMAGGAPPQGGSSQGGYQQYKAYQPGPNGAGYYPPHQQQSQLPIPRERDNSLDRPFKRNRRESAMMGMTIGLVEQRNQSKQSLRDHSGSRVPIQVQAVQSAFD